MGASNMTVAMSEVVFGCRLTACSRVWWEIDATTVTGAVFELLSSNVGGQQTTKHSGKIFVFNRDLGLCLRRILVL